MQIKIIVQRYTQFGSAYSTLILASLSFTPFISSCILATSESPLTKNWPRLGGRGVYIRTWGSNLMCRDASSAVRIGLSFAFFTETAATWGEVKCDIQWCCCPKTMHSLCWISYLWGYIFVSLLVLVYDINMSCYKWLPVTCSVTHSLKVLQYSYAELRLN